MLKWVCRKVTWGELIMYMILLHIMDASGWSLYCWGAIAVGGVAVSMVLYEFSPPNEDEET